MRWFYVLKNHLLNHGLLVELKFFSSTFYIYFTSKEALISGKFPSVTFGSSEPEETGASNKETTRREDDNGLRQCNKVVKLKQSINCRKVTWVTRIFFEMKLGKTEWLRSNSSTVIEKYKP